ncbi:MAG TPA: hypothetical protein VEA99_00895 [Gemmatimonadaceae bacterium]|nr:hypothetical protein [Gemmatimonadaceae bacterium]
MSESKASLAWPVAGGLDLGSILDALADERPVFHSEADFQHHLAWLIHRAEPRVQLRLEGRPDPTIREQLDLLARDPVTQTATAIELKYLKARWEGVVEGEPFVLLNQGAQDISRYDVVKDVARVERFVASNPGWNGYSVTLTNDASYWREPTRVAETIDAAFRIHHGAVLAGARAWGAAAGEGTMRGRKDALSLVGTHELAWRDYSDVGGSRGRFRVLVVPVLPHAAGHGSPAGS